MMALYFSIDVVCRGDVKLSYFKWPLRSFLNRDVLQSLKSKSLGVVMKRKSRGQVGQVHLVARCAVRGVPTALPSSSLRVRRRDSIECYPSASIIVAHDTGASEPPAVLLYFNRG